MIEDVLNIVGAEHKKAVRLDVIDLYKFLTYGKIFIGIYTMFFPNNIKVMLHFEIV